MSITTLKPSCLIGSVLRLPALGITFLCENFCGLYLCGSLPHSLTSKKMFKEQLEDIESNFKSESSSQTNHSTAIDNTVSTDDLHTGLKNIKFETLDETVLFERIKKYIQNDDEIQKKLDNILKKRNVLKEKTSKLLEFNPTDSQKINNTTIEIKGLYEDINKLLEKIISKIRKENIKIAPAIVNFLCSYQQVMKQKIIYLDMILKTTPLDIAQGQKESSTIDLSVSFGLQQILPDYLNLKLGLVINRSDFADNNGFRLNSMNFKPYLNFIANAFNYLNGSIILEGYPGQLFTQKDVANYTNVLMQKSGKEVSSPTERMTKRIEKAKESDKLYISAIASLLQIATPLIPIISSISASLYIYNPNLAPANDHQQLINYFSKQEDQDEVTTIMSIETDHAKFYEEMYKKLNASASFIKLGATLGYSDTIEKLSFGANCNSSTERISLNQRAHICPSSIDYEQFITVCPKHIQDIDNAGRIIKDMSDKFQKGQRLKPQDYPLILDAKLAIIVFKKYIETNETSTTDDIKKKIDQMYQYLSRASNFVDHIDQSAVEKFYAETCLHIKSQVVITTTTNLDSVTLGLSATTGNNLSSDDELVPYTEQTPTIQEGVDLADESFPTESIIPTQEQSSLDEVVVSGSLNGVGSDILMVQDWVHMVPIRNGKIITSIKELGGTGQVGFQTPIEELNIGNSKSAGIKNVGITEATKLMSYNMLDFLHDIEEIKLISADDAKTKEEFIIQSFMLLQLARQKVVNSVRKIEIQNKSETFDVSYNFVGGNLISSKEDTKVTSMKIKSLNKIMEIMTDSSNASKEIAESLVIYTKNVNKLVDDAFELLQSEFKKCESFIKQSSSENDEITVDIDETSKVSYKKDEISDYYFQASDHIQKKVEKTTNTESSHANSFLLLYLVEMQHLAHKKGYEQLNKKFTAIAQENPHEENPHEENTDEGNTDEGNTDEGNALISDSIKYLDMIEKLDTQQATQEETHQIPIKVCQKIYRGIAGSLLENDKEKFNKYFAMFCDLFREYCNIDTMLQFQLRALEDSSYKKHDEKSPVAIQQESQLKDILIKSIEHMKSNPFAIFSRNRLIAKAGEEKSVQIKTFATHISSGQAATVSSTEL